ncbi:hypothetical protein ABB37_09500 [Leptomonas pyrrhocoris]|uniref:Uncharacterized protein n=1 Tax=Leptomonas pyrrhocoris TaxID=157538 RepID=A0A0M9FQJ4_LEPPY|nr:hypothetical protein ABB37_09500 [Leptomonas pyrrhocoris]XP_015652318.1 hypothetical protein ABB37_09500 [Leptomonas pyrrhocoris]KPA73878.1 hypothetical protein ABB37_09500 [Leptomonas pyrrhocoris]KPA73879.1 hypothetical protein ABB37_09500 [Leptomonas pyrrhocoris]|eukprot:XP_015652317.1 hypothetical protein ABB37_09500 [Leptomonas pyrrhocoris]
MYNNTGEAEGTAYVYIRVCDLQIQYGNMPSGLDSGFHVDGLYVVLRCGDEVRRTNCLWPSTPSFPSSKGRLMDAMVGEEDENDWVWNELFRFELPHESPVTADSTAIPSQQGQRNGASAAGGNSSSSPVARPSLPSVPAVASCEGLFSAVLPMSTAGAAAAAAAAAATMSSAGGVSAQHSSAYSPQSPAPNSTPPLGGFQQHTSTNSPAANASNSPFLHPAVDLELWRSTPNSENCLGRYTYHVPLELLHGGYGLHPLDVVAERVVPLRTREAPSIMGNLYGWSGHRLSLRLRVQAVGLSPVAAEWMLPAGTASTSSAGAAGNYTLPYAFAMNDQTGRTAVLNASYVSSMGSINPVLANLLAPLGVLPMSGQGGPAVRPVPGVVGMGEPWNANLPPVFPLFPSPSAGAVLQSPTGSSALPASSEQGILGEGNPAWRGGVLPAVLH